MSNHKLEPIMAVRSIDTIGIGTKSLPEYLFMTGRSGGGASQTESKLSAFVKRWDSKRWTLVSSIRSFPKTTREWQTR